VKDLDDDSDEEGVNINKKKPEKATTKIMSAREIQGQEKTGDDFEEGQKLEPFNMEEELEEG